MVTNIDLYIVVEPFQVQNYTIEASIETQTCNSELTTQSKDNELSIVVEPIEAQNKRDLPIVAQPVEAKTIIDPPIVVEPIEAKTVIDLPIVAQPIIEAKSVINMPDEAENENRICIINYGAEFQGLVITDQEIECHPL